MSDCHFDVSPVNNSNCDSSWSTSAHLPDMTEKDSNGQITHSYSVPSLTVRLKVLLGDYHLVLKHFLASHLHSMSDVIRKAVFGVCDQCLFSYTS